MVVFGQIESKTATGTGMEEASAILSNDGASNNAPVAAETCDGTCTHGYACVRSKGHWGRCKCNVCYNDD